MERSLGQSLPSPRRPRVSVPADHAGETRRAARATSAPPLLPLLLSVLRPPHAVAERDECVPRLPATAVSRPSARPLSLFSAFLMQQRERGADEDLLPLCPRTAEQLAVAPLPSSSPVARPPSLPPSLLPFLLLQRGRSQSSDLSPRPGPEATGELGLAARNGDPKPPRRARDPLFHFPL